MPRFKGETCPSARPAQKRRGRRKIGQNLLESLVGFIVLIPLGLFSYDLTYILIACQNNERVAENAARAAANHGDSLSAQQAASKAVNDFQDSSTLKNITLTDFTYDPGNGQISLITQMNVTLPVPLASWKTMTISAQSLQPILATPAPM